ncbi:MAG: hypothetical protein IPF41_17345 [Flavobacteriales bacterium]|nr:hypothetical protein [Flavobacteriales bacterium]
METISDRLNEWYLLLSADFSVPAEHGRGPVPSEDLRADLDAERAQQRRPAEHLALGDQGQHRPLVEPGARGAGAALSFNLASGEPVRVRLVWPPAGRKVVIRPTPTVDRDYSFWLAGGLYSWTT